MTQAMAMLEAGGASMQRQAAQQRMLRTRLSGIWRHTGDNRDSQAEILHQRTGTSINACTVDSATQSAASIATWALNEADEFIRGGGEVGGQQFTLVFDSTKISFWLFPEGGDSSGGQVAAILDTALQSTQALQALAYDAIKDTQEMLKSTVSELSRSSVEKDKVIHTFMSAQMENARKVAELHDQAHLRDLEVKRLEAGEARKDRVVDQFSGLLGQAATLGGNVLMGKLEKKLSTEDPFAALQQRLDPTEQELFGVLFRRAMARDKGDKTPEEIAAIGAELIRTVQGSPSTPSTEASPATASSSNGHGSNGHGGGTNGAPPAAAAPASSNGHTNGHAVNGFTNGHAKKNRFTNGHLFASASLTTPSSQSGTLSELAEKPTPEDTTP